MTRYQDYEWSYAYVLHHVSIFFEDSEILLNLIRFTPEKVEKVYQYRDIDKIAKSALNDLVYIVDSAKSQDALFSHELQFTDDETADACDLVIDYVSKYFDNAEMVLKLTNYNRAMIENYSSQLGVKGVIDMAMSDLIFIVQSVRSMAIIEHYKFCR